MNLLIAFYVVSWSVSHQKKVFILQTAYQLKIKQLNFASNMNLDLFSSEQKLNSAVQIILFCPFHYLDVNWDLGVVLVQYAEFSLVNKVKNQNRLKIGNFLFEFGEQKV